MRNESRIFHLLWDICTFCECPSFPLKRMGSYVFLSQVVRSQWSKMWRYMITKRSKNTKMTYNPHFRLRNMQVKRATYFGQNKVILKPHNLRNNPWANCKNEIKTPHFIAFQTVEVIKNTLYTKPPIFGNEQVVSDISACRMLFGDYSML